MEYKSTILLRRTGVKASGLASGVSCALQTAYNWLNGDTLPNDRDAAAIAPVVGLDPALYVRLVRSDRDGLKKPGKHGARQALRAANKRKKVLGSNSDRAHAATLRRGRP